MSGQRMPEHFTHFIWLGCVADQNEVLKGRAGWEESTKRLRILLYQVIVLLSDNFCTAYLSPLTLTIATVW